MDPSDGELLRRLRAGDHTAFEALWSRHRARLHRHALVQSGGLEAVAEEVVQDVFMSLFDGQADPHTNVAGYLLAAVRHRTLNAITRRESRGERASLEDLANLMVGGAEHDPATQAHRREECERVAQAVLELSPEQREVVLLRSEGLAWREIAELTRVPLPTASTRYRAALARLRDTCRSLSHA